MDDAKLVVDWFMQLVNAIFIFLLGDFIVFKAVVGFFLLSLVFSVIFKIRGGNGN